MLADRFDVLITTSLDPKYDALLPGLSRKAVTVIAESVPVENARSCVAVNNYEAGLALGRWAGQYAQEHFRGRARVLDLTYSLPNTQARSRGFLDGLGEVLPKIQDVLSLNPLSRYDSAYQLTRDALLANRDINIIFAINDTNAWGAINACRDLKIDPSAVVVIPFGLEGDTLKDALATGCYCRAGLAMFPEIVGRVLIEAAIAAYNHQPLAGASDHAVRSHHARDPARILRQGPPGLGAALGCRPLNAHLAAERRLRRLDPRRACAAAHRFPGALHGTRVVSRLDRRHARAGRLPGDQP